MKNSHVFINSISDNVLLANRFGNQGVINIANNFTCGRNYILGEIPVYAAPYLYPFVVEYSLIASAVIFAMWRSIGSNPRYSTINNLLEILGFETHTLGNILWNKILYPNLASTSKSRNCKKENGIFEWANVVAHCECVSDRTQNFRSFWNINLAFQYSFRAVSYGFNAALLYLLL